MGLILNNQGSGSQIMNSRNSNQESSNPEMEKEMKAQKMFGTTDQSKFKVPHTGKSSCV